MPYRIYIPSGYENNRYPVVLYLHSAGERGNDNGIQISGGAPYYLFANGFIINNPAIIIAPQCPADKQWVDTNWTYGDYSTDEVEETVYLRMTYELLNKTIADYNADISRIYITGISMGGYGTWDMVTRHPDMFAAAVPICGAGDSGKAEVIKDIPIWAFHGDIDPVVPVSGVKKIMEACMKIDSNNFNLTIYENTYHDAWTPTYRNEDVFKWMFRQVKDSDLVQESTNSDTLSEQRNYNTQNTESESKSINHGVIFGVTAISTVLVALVIIIIKIIKS
jgi:Predicted peptidase